MGCFLAIVLLRHAIDLGFKDVARLKTDRALNPLRTHEEFRKLLAAAEAAASRGPR